MYIEVLRNTEDLKKGYQKHVLPFVKGGIRPHQPLC